jgi:hypothetical protein
MSDDHNSGDLIPLSRGARPRKPSRPQAPVPGDARQMDDLPLPWTMPETDLGDLRDELGRLVKAVERLGDILDKRLA